MSVFSNSDFDNHERISFFSDESSGLRAIVAIHNTALGMALGGCRMRPYATEEEALADALRLSAGMSRKCAISGLPFGGGKTVIMGDPETDKTPELLHALGRFLKQFEGRYMTGEDMGMGNEDFLVVAEKTNNLVGLDPNGDLMSSGHITAIGVQMAIETTIDVLEPGATLKGKTVAIQGLGHVGHHLVSLLVDQGASVVVCDVYPEALIEVAHACGATVVAIDDIYSQDVDIFAPCAMGGILNPDTLPQLKCKMIVGAANNQLSDPAMADELAARGITYVPDYVANQGGLIRVGHEAMAIAEGRPYSEKEATAYLGRVSASVREVLELALAQNIKPLDAAEKLALARIREAEDKRRAEQLKG